VSGNVVFKGTYGGGIGTVDEVDDVEVVEVPAADVVVADDEVLS
jgi:hypothetical protein